MDMLIRLRNIVFEPDQKNSGREKADKKRKLPEQALIWVKIRNRLIFIQDRPHQVKL